MPWCWTTGCWCKNTGKFIECIVTYFLQNIRNKTTSFLPFCLCRGSDRQATRQKMGGWWTAGETKWEKEILGPSFAKVKFLILNTQSFSVKWKAFPFYLFIFFYILIWFLFIKGLILMTHMWKRKKQLVKCYKCHLGI